MVEPKNASQPLSDGQEAGFPPLYRLAEAKDGDVEDAPELYVGYHEEGGGD